MGYDQAVFSCKINIICMWGNIQANGSDDASLKT